MSPHLEVFFFPIVMMILILGVEGIKGTFSLCILLVPFSVLSSDKLFPPHVLWDSSPPPPLVFPPLPLTSLLAFALGFLRVFLCLAWKGLNCFLADVLFHSFLVVSL